MMDDKSFDFYRDHSTQFLKMALANDWCERLADPDGYGRRTGVCGDTVEFFLKVRKNTVDTLSFVMDGCIHTRACCNTVVHLAGGKRVEDAWEIGPDEVADYLETLPPDHFHCAELSLGALYLALADYVERRRAPWKKMYGTF